MSSSSRIPDASIGAQHEPQLATLGWALRRAALGLLMLLVMVTLGAWLMYASIEPDDTATGMAPGGQVSGPQR